MRDFTRRLNPILILLGAVWAVEAVNLVGGHWLAGLGILPRQVSGLAGIALAPFIHAGLWHAAGNSIPLLILGGLCLTDGTRRFWILSASIIVLGGALTWLFARGAYHVGASGLVFGYFGALLARAFLERSLRAVGVGFAVVFFYGGIIFWGLLPLGGHVSFEGHLFGLLAGIAVEYAMARRRR
jgi:membrane associated rhomboid family serine protease